jgi:cyanophycin synthetase
MSGILESSTGVLPLVSVAGTRGKSTVSWMLTAALVAGHKSSASWLSSGVWVDGELQDGELGPWSRVVLAARHREIDVATQEMNAATVVGAGLPERAYPIVILTTLCGNHESCLLNAETERERRALAIVTRSVRPDGLIIANADDYDIAELAFSAQAEAALYALHPESPALQRHLARGGLGSWVESGHIVAGGPDGALPIVPVSEIPATLDGAILFQTQNALAATCAGLAIGVDGVDIARGLKTFEPRPDRQPAACNVLAFNDATILVDAPRQIAPLRMLARGIKHKPRRRTIVVSGSFQGLPDEDVHEAGRILGSLGGIVLLHSDNAGEERMDAIKAGIASAAVPPIVLSVPGEAQAIDHLLNTVAPDDVALVIADEPDVVLGHLWPAPAISVDSIKRGKVASSQ